MNIPATKHSPPYYAVIFSSLLAPEAGEDYQVMADKMEILATGHSGYLGMESVRQADGHGITVSYWQDSESIQRWKQDIDHILAQKMGKEHWYQQYSVSVSLVERQYNFEQNADN